MVHIVPDPEECLEAESGEVALKYCPVGIWVCFDDCNEVPLASHLCDKIDPSAREALWRLNSPDPTSSKGPESKVKPVHERMAFVPAVTRTFSRMIFGRNGLLSVEWYRSHQPWIGRFNLRREKRFVAELSATWQTSTLLGMSYGRHCMYYSPVLLAWMICCCCGVRRRASSMAGLRHT